MESLADVDLAILGGGCAGLSLAVQLAEHPQLQRNVVVLESRTDYVRDRTWCGWSITPHTFQACIDRSWSRWSTRHQGREVVHQSTSLPYEHIRADRFYANARERISSSSAVSLRTGAKVTGVTKVAGGLEVLVGGDVLRAKTVIDTRPAAGGTPSHPVGALLQHFVGQEVITEDPVFDPETATLMDFDVDQSGGIHFIYVLPMNERRALVESTMISSEPLARDVYEARILDYVQSTLGTRVASVEFAEAGVIPMHAMPAEVGPSAIHLAGTRGGAVKPSSGYGFHAIQKQVAGLADVLVRGGNPNDLEVRSRLDRWLDQVFLGFIARHPSRGPEVFQRLFDRVDAPTIARFLMERPTIMDRLRVVASMPKLPFAREAFRTFVP